MPRDDELRLQDIVLAARSIEGFLDGVTQEQFLANIEKQYAVLHALEIIGEAARLVSDNTKVELPGIPWDEIRGMRNRLAHEYFAVDLNIVWDTLKRDLPQILNTLD